MNPETIPWETLTGDRTFILDLGSTPDVAVQLDDSTTERLGRYGAFVPVPNFKRHQIVEVSSDLADLQQRYQVPDEFVLQLEQPDAGPSCSPPLETAASPNQLPHDS